LDGSAFAIGYGGQAGFMSPDGENHRGFPFAQRWNIYLVDLICIGFGDKIIV